MVDDAIAPVSEMEIRALESEAQILLSRMQFMRSAGVSFKGMRDLYEILGYDRDISPAQYRDRYERGGIAGTIVDVMVDATWRGGMELIEDEDPEKHTPFEEAWLELEERLNLATYMIRADRLSRLSDYAILLIGTSLNGDLATELPRGKAENLIYLQPFAGGGGPAINGRNQSVSGDVRARVESYDKDPASPRFGLPATYSLKLDDGQWAPSVHASRVVHVAEGCLDDDVFGRSVLKRVWNLLDDLDKITGGGSEAFWLRANQGTHLNIDKDLALQPGEFATVVEKLREQSELYKHQQTRWLQTRGVDVKTLGSDVANFAGPADAVLKQIAGSSRIPTRILTGSEMGELASSQDRENFKDQINGRQEQHVGPNLVRRVADRFIQYGYLPEPKEGPRKYRVKWAHIQTMTEQEKVTGAQGWASVNSTHGDLVFTDAEIREKWADMAPLTDEQRKEIADRKAEAAAAEQAAAAPSAPAAPVDEETLLDFNVDGDASLKAAAVGFEEDEHPRKGGQFASKGGGGSSAVKAPPSKAGPPAGWKPKASGTIAGFENPATGQWVPDNHPLITGKWEAPVKEARESFKNGLTKIHDSLAEDEKKALAGGYAAAKKEGFEGSDLEFMRQQLALYGTAEEGDPRLKTYFYGKTIDKYNTLRDTETKKLFPEAKTKETTKPETAAKTGKGKNKGKAGGKGQLKRERAKVQAEMDELEKKDDGSGLVGKDMDRWFALKEQMAALDDKKKKTKLKAAEEAEDAELVRVLAAAIECGNEDVVLQIVGLERKAPDA